MIVGFIVLWTVLYLGLGMFGAYQHQHIQERRDAFLKATPDQRNFMKVHEGHSEAEMLGKSDFWYAFNCYVWGFGFLGYFVIISFILF